MGTDLVCGRLLRGAAAADSAGYTRGFPHCTLLSAAWVGYYGSASLADWVLLATSRGNSLRRCTSCDSERTEMREESNYGCLWRSAAGSKLQPYGLLPLHSIGQRH